MSSEGGDQQHTNHEQALAFANKVHTVFLRSMTGQRRAKRGPFTGACAGDTALSLARALQ
ncbi:hypothetical protein OR60_14030 [Xanthomonas vesicatoria]|uniref:Uncharacterized protein n=1 Tax=Xanthomonas vesicatoria TaxID=56460 RepID=A0AAJ0IZF2_9XANT|nr:hypothetical protein OR60_14030 [Xanthomonas vesicatoria]KHM95878.1 hypothetical protein OR61_07915 [Xanthomonas vesicatoria]KTF36226.1 hypothetical protein LMG919_12425 [Xanthomonas vesicatoria]